MIICKNCKQEFKGNFCNNCGQPAETDRLKLSFILHYIQLRLLHVNKELLYSIKEMFTRPGLTIREFIDGKRMNHFKPFSFVIVLATIYGVLYHFLHINDVSAIAGNVSNPVLNMEKFNEWRLTHISIVELIYLPLFSFSSWHAFRKNRFNLTEHFVLNAFITGQVLFVYLIFFPLLIIYNGTPTLSILLELLLLLKIILIWWGYSQFFRPGSAIKIFLKTIITFIYFLISASILVITVIILNRYLLTI